MGGISFDSGFSSGFQTTPLEISNFEIASLTPSVTASTSFNINVDVSVLEINQTDANFKIGSDTVVSSLELLIESKTVAISTGVICHSNTSNIEIYPNNSSIIDSDSIDVNVTNLDILSPLVSVLNTNSVTIPVEPSVLLVNSDVQFIKNGVNLDVNVVNINADTNSVDFKNSHNLLTDKNNIDVITNDVSVITSIVNVSLVNANVVDFVVQPLAANLVSSHIINVDSTPVNIAPTNSLIRSESYIPVDNILYELSTLSTDIISSNKTNVESSNISITPYTPTVTITNTAGFYPDVVTVDISAPNNFLNVSSNIFVNSSIVEVSATDSALSVLSISNIHISAKSPSVKTCSILNSAITLLNISINKIDGVGNKIPNWANCDSGINNSYWDKDTACRDKESQMFDNIIDNSFNMYGVDAVWYPVDYSTNNERTFGEDNNRKVLRNFKTKYYNEDLNSNLTDNQQWNKWGIEGIDNAKIWIGKNSFHQHSQLNMLGRIASRPYLPKPGDIMLSKHLDVFYEVVEVKDRVELFLQRSHAWEITIRPMTNKHFTIDPSLSGDLIETIINSEDVLEQNEYIDEKKSDILYNDGLGHDPFNLF